MNVSTSSQQVKKAPRRLLSGGKLSSIEGDILTEAYYSGLWGATDNGWYDQSAVQSLAERGLLRIEPLNSDTEMTIAFVTKAGERAVESGVPHKTETVPLCHRPLSEQLAKAEAWLSLSGEDQDEYETPGTEDAPIYFARHLSYTKGGTTDLLWGNGFLPPRMPKPPEFEGLHGCGILRPRGSTAKLLYRSLYLFQPKCADFTDMYKPVLWASSSWDGRFAMTVGLFKYEFELEFYCQHDLVQPEAPRVGWRGDRKMRGCSDPLGRRWFKVMTALIERKHDIYPGNNFAV